MSTSPAPGKLTQRRIYALQSTGKKQRYRDHEVRGLELRVTPAGTKTYAVRYRKPDRSRGEISIGSANTLTLEQARRRAREILVEIAKGHDPLSERQSEIQKAQQRRANTVEALADRWINSPGFKALKATSQS